MRVRPARRASTLLAVGLAAIVLPTTAAVAAPTDDPALAAGGFVARELGANGDRFTQEFGGVDYDSYGPTVDGVLALAATQVGQDQADATTQYLADNLGAYVGAGTEHYAGATAKSLYLATVQGEDPAAFGGVDLVTTLQDLEDATGFFRDASTFGDFSNTLGQSFAVVALTREGTGASPAAVTALRDQQCADGGFRLDPDEACTSDVDSTSYAVQALAEVAGPTDADVVAGLEFLAATQGPDGSVVGNANSTGLAAQAFVAGGYDDEAALAQGFVASLQYDCTFPEALRGGIAPDADAFADRQAEGDAAVADISDQLATSQALLGLVGTSMGDLAAGGSADVPTLDCEVPPTTTPPVTPPVEPSPTTSTTDGAVIPTTDANAPVRDGAELANTGAGTAGQGALVGAGMVLLGGALVIAMRRQPARGRHL